MNLNLAYGSLSEEATERCLRVQIQKWSRVLPFNDTGSHDNFLVASVSFSAEWRTLNPVAFKSQVH